MNRPAEATFYRLTRTKAGVCRIQAAVRHGDKIRYRYLGLRLNLRNHSPAGFEWGWGVSGSAQAALAILADFYDDRRAVELYQMFKWDFIAKVDHRGGTITGAEIQKWRETCADVKKVFTDP